MIHHVDIDKYELQRRLRDQSIQFGGHKGGKIYGSLHCPSGKRMRKENRVFFKNAEEANDAGYRPCGHCMKKEYLEWKNDVVRNAKR